MYIKKLIFFLLIIPGLAITENLWAQPADSVKISTPPKLIGTVYSNFHSEPGAQNNAFNINRAYMGFQTQKPNIFSGLVEKILKRPVPVLLIFLAFGLAVRLALLPIRWINPDEGAHLMDAKLLMDGLLPVADFGSRQPFYVFMLSVFLKIFGMSYLAGRLLPIVSSLGIGWMLYLIGRRMFDSTVGLISAAIYLFLPLTIIWAPVVKTEPLAVFLGCIAVYFLVLSLDSGIRRGTWMIPSGIFAALAFYVRQPTLYLPLAIITFTLFLRNVRVTEMVQRIFFFLMGYLSITVA